MVQRPELLNGEIAQKVVALKKEMAGWKTIFPSQRELKPYGYDLILRARAILRDDSTEILALVPVPTNATDGESPVNCHIRISPPRGTLDTRTTGSIRTLSILEKLPNGSNYPLPDHTLQIIEFFVPNLHVGEYDEQVINVVSAIRNSTTPEEVLRKGKVAFTIFPDGQVVDWLELWNFPENMTLCAAALLDMERITKPSNRLILASS